jgi:predicted CXXCH cytochrome family protein
LDDLLTNDHASDECLHCKSGQYTYAGGAAYGIQANELLLNNTAFISSGVISSITCATCHDPHDDANDTQLRFDDVTDLCSSCHGGGGRHLEYDLLTDEDWISPHEDLDCIECHGYELHGDNATDPGDWALNHTWTLDLDSDTPVCGQPDCHRNGTKKVVQLVEMQETYETLWTAYEGLLTNVTAKVDAANATAGIDQAEVDSAYALIDQAGDLAAWAEYDNSEGFHNPSLVKAKLIEATGKLNLAYAIADRAGPAGDGGDATSCEEVSTEADSGVPGFLFISVLLSIIAAAAFYLRKRQ